MGSMIAFGLFFSFLFGATMLMLVMGFVNTENKRVQEQKAREVEDQRFAQIMATMPRFFAKPDSNELPSASSAFDDRLLANLERFVKSEQALVTLFVNEPSIDTLYRQPSSSLEIN